MLFRSDRALSNIAVFKGLLDKTKGSNAHEIAELIRNVSGLLTDDKYPWDDDFYGIPNEQIASLIKEGQPWYKDWELRHEWVWTNNPTPQEKRNLIKDALTKGTVCASVYAWKEGPTDGVFIKPPGSRDGHWTSVVQARGDEPYIIFDSYPQYVKKLDPLFDYGYAKVYYLVRKVPHTFLKSMRFGMTDPEVPELQKALISLGYTIQIGRAHV